jgi:hypothetical protein
MSGDESGPRNPLDELRQIIGDPFDDGDFADVPAPTHWPSVSAADAAAEWDGLRTWVEALRERFGHLDHHVIPRCWWRHNDHVEALAALRDHERSSFAGTAPATAPVDWFRALRDITALLKTWTAELGCGAAHQDPPVPLRAIDSGEWDRFVTADVARRQEREIAQAAQ